MQTHPLDETTDETRSTARIRGRDGHLGRLTVDHTAGCHRWEWWHTPWPSAAFALVPDASEPAADPVTSDAYALPARPARSGSATARPRGVYAIWDTDEHVAWLVVSATALDWIERVAGAIDRLGRRLLDLRPCRPGDSVGDRAGDSVGATRAERGQWVQRSLGLASSHGAWPRCAAVEDAPLASVADMPL